MGIETRQWTGRPVVVAKATSRPPRPDARVPVRGPAGLPAEIAFLSGQGVAPDVLLRAAAVARRTGVSADRALLGEGFAADTFYALLARHLGLPFVDEPMRLALPAGRGREGAAAGVVPLAANACRLRFLMAPQGAGLAALLHRMQPGRGRGTPVGITAPRRLERMVRDLDGPLVADRASHGLGLWDATLSAETGPRWGQQGVAAVVTALAGAGLICYPAETLWLGAIGLSLLFFAAVLLRLVATTCNVAPVPSSDPPLPDHALPVYTVVIPLYREAKVVRQLVTAMERLDYPRAKLDIKLMIEADDPETLTALEALDLPDRYDIVVAPPGWPQTKPRALNIGLAYARGDLLVVYDAEDVPDPGQLRAAAARFNARPSTVACLQARLLVDHLESNWLSLMFGLDYAALFGVIKPGLATVRLPVPLGGTSNHFRVAALRRAGGWDAWNVTEDIDLGFRLARFGYRIEALDSTTFEEAPLTLPRWLAQRSRWLKGWMVTLTVHTRQPGRLFRELGPFGGAAVAISLLGTITSSLLAPLFGPLALYALWRGRWLNPVSPAEALIAAASLYLLVAGVVSAIWPQVIALKRMRRLDLAIWVSTLPVYLLLVSLAAWRALAEVVVDPQRWNKTDHGFVGRPSLAAKGLATATADQAATFQAPRPLSLMS